MEKLRNAMLEFMQCSLCKEYIEPPVTEICRNGHNGCRTCVRKLTKCPICQLPAEKFWNNGVEETCRNMKIEIPCNNRFWGCEVKSLIDNFTDHIVECMYQELRCPFSSPRDCCTWKGLVVDVRSHVMRAHKDCTVISTEEEIINLSYKCVTRKVVIFRRHEVFLVTTDFSVLNLFHYACIRVYYVGPCEGFPKYTFEFKLGRNCETTKPVVTNSITTPDKKRNGDLHFHVPPEHLATPDDKIVPLFRKEYHIKISNYVPKPFVSDVS